MGKRVVALAGLIAVVSMFMTPALAQYRSHSYYRSYRPYPAACEAVFFPRSPLCAGRPAYRGFWSTLFPYNWIVYY
jgi:hypothetical protein